MSRNTFILSAMFLLFGPILSGQAFQPNYDEAKVPEYALPDPLVFENGERVRSRRQWSERRRELLGLFEEHVYGKAPGPPAGMHFKIRGLGEEALGGKAFRKQVTVFFSEEEDGPRLDLLLYLPAERRDKVPVFLGLNFYGNQSIHPDPGISLPSSWVRNNENFGITEHRATEASRGRRANRWPVERILARGYGLVTAYYGDISPDRDSALREGVHQLYFSDGQERPAPDEWAAIGAWAWGLQRAMDYLAYDPDVDEERVALLGHSRLGKAALWAGAQDERFAIVISNNSGCGGAALSRRRYGETIGRINASFPHWFCGNFRQYSSNEDELPVDQHQLIALIAPRPVYVASAEEDRWADPRGEFLAARAADPVYRLLRVDGLATDQQPPVGEPVMSRIGYHLRAGGHDVTDYDWERFMDFADAMLPKF